MSRFAHLYTRIRASRSYDPETALSLAVACDLAYKAESTITGVAKRWGYSAPQFVEVKKGGDIDTQGFVMSDPDNIVCVMRGSDSVEDWFANFQAAHNPGPLRNTRAHEGFQDALYPAVIALTNAIDNQGGAGKRIWLTGHSLGGALCSLYAGMLLENNYPVYGIYTYASPRPGDDNFATRLNKKLEHGPHYRIANEGDVVPHVPPEPFFSHPGRRILLQYNRRQRSKSAWTEMRQTMFNVLMKMTGGVWKIKSNHQLHAKHYGYIWRLKADLARHRKKSS
jgi:triacylglycerol lipase